MRLLIELLPYHAPKLTAVAHVTDGSFGALLDAASERSSKPLKLIEAKAEPAEQQHDPSELKGPMSQLCRW